MLLKDLLIDNLTELEW